MGDTTYSGTVVLEDERLLATAPSGMVGLLMKSVGT